MAKETNKKIHEHIKMVARLNTGLALTGLVAVLILVVWLRWFGGVDSVQQAADETGARDGAAVEIIGLPDSAVDQKELASDYRDQLNDILDGYDFVSAERAAEISDELLDLTLPTAYRTVQLQTAIALDEVQEGKITEAQDRIRQLQADNDWYLPDTSL